MIWLIFSIILGLNMISFAVFGISPGYKLGVPALAAVVWLILTVALYLHTVGQREVGLVQSFSGAISNSYKTTGVVFTAPWNHIKKENIGLLKDTFVFEGNNDAVSKDQQAIDAVVTLNYRLE